MLIFFRPFQHILLLPHTVVITGIFIAFHCPCFSPLPDIAISRFSPSASFTSSTRPFCFAYASVPACRFPAAQASPMAIIDCSLRRFQRFSVLLSFRHAEYFAIARCRRCTFAALFFAAATPALPPRRYAAVACRRSSRHAYARRLLPALCRFLRFSASHAAATLVSAATPRCGRLPWLRRFAAPDIVFSFADMLLSVSRLGVSDGAYRLSATDHAAASYHLLFTVYAFATFVLTRQTSSPSP